MTQPITNPPAPRGRRLRATLALAALAVSLAGCVVYPNGGYGYGYAPAYYAPPVVVPPVYFGFGYRGGWGRWR